MGAGSSTCTGSGSGFNSYFFFMKHLKSFDLKDSFGGSGSSGLGGGGSSSPSLKKHQRVFLVVLVQPSSVIGIIFLLHKPLKNWYNLENNPAKREQCFLHFSTIHSLILTHQTFTNLL
jgi:hypothetical protein